MDSTPPSGLYILAVEDDPIYAETLQMLLPEMGYTHFAIVDNAMDALQLFKKQPPDLLLMDIGIAGALSGIEFVQIVSAIRSTPVIYLTAFSDAETFQKAKNTAPSAYLLKPYNEKNLELAMELALFQSNQKPETANEAATYKIDNSCEAFFVKYNNRLLKVPISDLLYVEVDEKYCFLHTKDRRYTVNIRLKNLLDELPSNKFLQTHRSFAVRLDAIEEVNLEDDSVKVNGKEIPIGKTYKEVVFAKLKTI